MLVRNKSAHLRIRCNIITQGASLTVPSALQLIVSLFPDPVEQAKAVSYFTATSGIGNGERTFLDTEFIAR